MQISFAFVSLLALSKIGHAQTHWGHADSGFISISKSANAESKF